MHLPCYILSGLLALMLVIREFQHSRINQGLIDKILESRGMAPLPNEHPLAEAVASLVKKDEPLTEKRKAEMLERVRFKIPGMPEYRTNK